MITKSMARTTRNLDLHLMDEDLAWLEEQKQFSTWQVILVVKMVVTSVNTDTDMGVVGAAV
jgi:hypothetical protein